MNVLHGWDIGQKRYEKLLIDAASTDPLTLPEALLTYAAFEYFVTTEGIMQQTPPTFYIMTKCYHLEWFNRNYFEKNLDSLTNVQKNDILNGVGLNRWDQLKKVARGQTATYIFCIELANIINRIMGTSHSTIPVFKAPDYRLIGIDTHQTALHTNKRKNKVCKGSMHSGVCRSVYSPVIGELQNC